MKRLVAVLVAGAAWAGAAQAEDNVLWRAINPLGAESVPAYAGQPSPFPLPVVAKVVSDTQPEESSEEASIRAARVTALQEAEKLLASRTAVAPDMGAIVVGGSIDGPQGRRVLINNQWVGINTQVAVRLVRSYKAASAIETLREYDTSAADELSRRLDVYIANNPVLKLTLQRIQSGTLVFSSQDGTQVVPFQLRQE